MHVLDFLRRLLRSPRRHVFLLLVVILAATIVDVAVWPSSFWALFNVLAPKPIVLEGWYAESDFLQRALRPEEAGLLVGRAGVNAIMIGVIVTGREAESLRAATARLTRGQGLVYPPSGPAQGSGRHSCAS